MAQPNTIIPGYGNLNQLVFVNTSVLMSVLAPYPQPFGSFVNTPVAVNTKQRNQLKPTDIKICVKDTIITEIPKHCIHVNINRKKTIIITILPLNSFCVNILRFFLFVCLFLFQRFGLEMVSKSFHKFKNDIDASFFQRIYNQIFFLQVYKCVRK